MGNSKRRIIDSKGYGQERVGAILNLSPCKSIYLCILERRRVMDVFKFTSLEFDIVPCCRHSPSSLFSESSSSVAPNCIASTMSAVASNFSPD